MLVPRFTFKNVQDGDFSWIATSEYEKAGRYRGFTAVGRTLTDVKRFAEIVRWCERTAKLRSLVGTLNLWNEKQGFKLRGAGTSITGRRKPTQRRASNKRLIRPGRNAVAAPAA